MVKTVQIGNYEINALLLAAAVIAVVLMLFILALAVLRSYRKKEILSRFSPTAAATVKLLRLTFGYDSVINNISLPVFDGKRISHYVFADTIVLTRRAVAVLSIRTEAGLIYCDEGFDWHQSARLRSGGTLETDFSDPVEQNEKAVSALRALFERREIEPPQITGMTVFTSRSAKFSCNRSGVYKLPEAYSRLKTHGGGKIITKNSLKLYRRLILTNAVRKEYADGYNAKKTRK